MARKKDRLTLGNALSVLSIIGFIGIWFDFSFDNPIISQSMTPLFLVLGGIGLIFVGRIFSIREWTRDGIQDREFIWVLALGIGLISIVIGVLVWLGIDLGDNKTLVGWLALAPATFIALQFFKGSRN